MKEREEERRDILHIVEILEFLKNVWAGHFKCPTILCGCSESLSRERKKEIAR